ncbi:unnamed protein product [Caretta caretta]
MENRSKSTGADLAVQYRALGQKLESRQALCRELLWARTTEPAVTLSGVAPDSQPVRPVCRIWKSRSAMGWRIHYDEAQQLIFLHAIHPVCLAAQQRGQDMLEPHCCKAAVVKRIVELIVELPDSPPGAILANSLIAVGNLSTKKLILEPDLETHLLQAVLHAIFTLGMEKDTTEVQALHKVIPDLLDAMLGNLLAESPDTDRLYYILEVSPMRTGGGLTIHEAEDLWATGPQPGSLESSSQRGRKDPFSGWQCWPSTTPCCMSTRLVWSWPTPSWGEAQQLMGDKQEDVTANMMQELHIIRHLHQSASEASLQNVEELFGDGLEDSSYVHDEGCRIRTTEASDGLMDTDHEWRMEWTGPQQARNCQQ